MPSFEFVITAFLGISLAVSIISSRTKAPYPIVLVLAGLLIAGTSLSTIFGVNLLYDNLIGGGLFVGLVLPPLLFETMMNIRYDVLRSVIGPAIRLATFGVVVATIVGGLILWLFANMPLYSAFIFSSLISPTDTATVLEIFRRSPVPRKLATLMDTEAGFNDATGIAVFTAVLTSFVLTGQSLVRSTINFGIILGGGVIIGIVVALTADLLSRLVKDPLSETMITVTLVYGSYTVAELLNASGLIAVAVAGLVYGNLTLRRRVQPQSMGVVRIFWRIMAFIANSLAFLYIGLSTNLGRLMADLQAIIFAFVAVLTARIATVYPLLGTSKVDGEKIPRSWQNVAVLGGMKGALSIVLAASLPASTPSRDLISSMVLGVAFASIIIQGVLLSRYTKRSFSRPGNKKPRHSLTQEVIVETSQLEPF